MFSVYLHFLEGEHLSGVQHRGSLREFVALHLACFLNLQIFVC